MSRYDLDDGRSVSSVTQVLHLLGGPPLQWAANEMRDWIMENSAKGAPDEFEGEQCWYVFEDDLEEARFAYKGVSEKALKVGSEVHTAIEEFLTGKNNAHEWHKESMNAFNAFMSWYNKHKDNIKTISTEHRVVGDVWAGTLDWHLEFYGEEGILDFKTSKRLYKPSVRIQTAAYRSAIHGNPVWNGALRLDKSTGEYEFEDYRDTYESDLMAFNYLIDAWYATKPRLAKMAGWPEKREGK